jgi:hypothetical protein
MLPLSACLVRAAGLPAGHTICCRFGQTISCPIICHFCVLQDCLLDFLMLMSDPDRHVRKAAVVALSAVVHHKPGLVAAGLEQLLPQLFDQTEVKPEMVGVSAKRQQCIMCKVACCPSKLHAHADSAQQRWCTTSLAWLLLAWSSCCRSCFTRQKSSRRW